MSAARWESRLRWSARQRRVALLVGVAIVLPCYGCAKKAERIDLSRYVQIDPGWGIVELRGEKAQIKVRVRNISRRALEALKLEATSPAVTTKVSPASIARLIPGEREAFAVALSRKAGAKAQRHALALTLEAKGLPVAAGLDLVVDLDPPKGGEWVSVGQIKLVRRSGSKSLYYLLIGFPLLLIVGWLLWRVSQRRRPPARGADKEEQA